MPSKLVSELSPFYVMEVLERAKELENNDKNIIHFEIGEPDIPTDELICRAAVESITKGHTKYTESMGMIELRKVISGKYNHAYGLNTSYRNVAVTMGSSPAIFLTLLSLIDPKDEVIIIEPYYPCYPQLIKIAGGIPVKVRVFEEDGFQIDIKKLREKISSRTKAIILNSPSNPTGVIIDPRIFREISELGIHIISDEIYHGLEYTRNTNTVLEFTDRAFVINGFSKLYSMTGWRLGYCIVPDEFIRPLQKLQQNLFISPNSFVQSAGITAIEMGYDKISSYNRIFKKRREKMIKGLKDIGFDINTEPDGAFYIFINISHLSDNSYDLAFDILEQVHLAVTPGIDFGESCREYLRLSYTSPTSSIEEGLKRLRHYVTMRQ